VIESRYTGSQGAEDVLVSALESIEHQTSVIGSRHEFSDGVGEHEQTKMLNQQRLRATFARLCIS
jgi:hypothetical protein